MIGACSEAHSANFVVIQTHPSHRLYLAVDVPGLGWSGPWPRIIDQARDFPKQVPRHGTLGQLERDIAAMRATASSAGITNFRKWLGAAVQRCPLGLPLSARKQTFVPQCRLMPIRRSAGVKLSISFGAKFPRSYNALPQG